MYISATLAINICIYLMREQSQAIAGRFAALRVGDVGMSVITLAELRFGVDAHPADRKRNERALHALLADIPAVPLDARGRLVRRHPRGRSRSEAYASIAWSPRTRSAPT
jgi:tRNA(fMet)-specific endonuclease VapC